MANTHFFLFDTLNLKILLWLQENFPPSHSSTLRSCCRQRDPKELVPTSLGEILSFTWYLSPHLHSFPLPDSEIVIINQKTTACQPERAHSIQKNVFPHWKIYKFCQPRKWERTAEKKLIEKRFWFIGYTAAAEQPASQPAHQKEEKAFILCSLYSFISSDCFAESLFCSAFFRC